MSGRANSLVLFDIDGTLMRGAGQYHKQALIDAVEMVTGRCATLDGVPTAGVLDRDLIGDMLRASGESDGTIEEMGRTVAEQCAALYQSYCREDLSAYVCRNVRETLNELSRRGAALALVTGNLAAIGWRKVGLAGIRQHFMLGAFSEDGSTRAMLASIAQKRAVQHALISESARVTLIGDHTNDIAAAKANGFQSVAVATGVLSLQELRSHKPDIAVENLGELNLDLLFGL